MINVPVGKLIDKALDYAVGIQSSLIWEGGWYKSYRDLHDSDTDFAPSIVWEQGGKIIDSCGLNMTVQQVIDLNEDRAAVKLVKFGDPFNGDGPAMTGPTVLIAAMRAYVAFYNRNGVFVPKELLDKPEKVHKRIASSFSVLDGIVTLDNGETVDLTKIHESLEQAYRDSGSDYMLEEMRQLGKISGKLYATRSDYFDR